MEMNEPVGVSSKNSVQITEADNKKGGDNGVKTVDLTRAYGPYAPYVRPEREPFTVQKSDGIFAIVCLLLGYILVRWGAPWQSGWGVTAGSLAFVAAVGLYARTKGIRPSKESWYWLAIAVSTGITYSLWPGGWLAPARGLLLAGAMVYWCGTLFGVLLKGKTSNYLPLDAVNLTVLLPFRNCDITGKTWVGLLGGRKALRQALRVSAPVIAGLLLCIPLLALVLPLLASADAGIFNQFYWEFFQIFSKVTLWRILPHIFPWFFAVPLGLYLYWMLGGAAHKRYAKNIDPLKVRRSLSGMALVPQPTVLVVLAVVSAVYVLFIACQVPYFFSGFAGVKPEGYRLYSEYARQGFFELCFIAGLNLGVMAAANGFCRTSARQSRLLRILNLTLCALTLLLIATAFSKMMLYIGVYGLTPKRVCTSVFLVFLAGVWAAAAVLQFKSFSIVRFAALYGAGLLCALCLCNLDAQIARYNAAHDAQTAVSEPHSLPDWYGGTTDALEGERSPGEKAGPGRQLRLEQAAGNPFGNGGRAVPATGSSLYIEKRCPAVFGLACR